MLSTILLGAPTIMTESYGMFKCERPQKSLSGSCYHICYGVDINNKTTARFTSKQTPTFKLRPTAWSVLVLGEKEAFFQVLPMSFDLACDALQYRKAPSTKHQSRFVVVILEFTVVASARGSGASLVLWLSL